MQIITCCRVCESPKIRPFFDLGSQPLANSLPSSPDVEEDSFSLSLSFCDNCSLVQLNETIDPELLFSEYVWVTGTSKGAKEFSEEFCQSLIQRTTDAHDGYILEIASNDGTFLKPFLRRSHTVIGVDPAKNICDIALAAGVPTTCAFWSSETAKSLIVTQGQARAIFARNVLAHVANLKDFVKGITDCLHDEGTVALEVHYAGNILKGLQYDSIYHEHLCYFTLKPLEKLLSRHGLFVFDAQPSPISGGALIIYARKSVSKASIHYREREEQDRCNEFQTWEAFANKAFTHRDELRKVLTDMKERRDIVVGWGASARSSTLLNFCGITTDFLPMIADQNRLKQGRFTAGTHIPIQSPKDVMAKKPTTILITGWNFSSEICESLKNNFQFTGSVVIPLPNFPTIRTL